MIVENPLSIDVYVSNHCFLSAYTQEVIETIRQEFPQVEVHVIEISQATDLPEAVFATPTYLLNGRLWSLGNPSMEQIRATLAH